MRKIENRETLFLTSAFLLTILATSVHNIINVNNLLLVLTFKICASLLLTILACAILISAHKERITTNGRLYNIVSLVISLVIIIMNIVFYLKSELITPFLISGLYLLLSIIYSMITLLMSKPVLIINKSDKIEKLLLALILSIATIILVYHIIFKRHYILSKLEMQTSVYLSINFIILASIKLIYDIKRLRIHSQPAQVIPGNLEGFEFTKHEKSVITLIVQGKSFQEISENLSVSTSIVKTHLSHIYQKLDERNKLELYNYIKGR
ncbi:MAG: helix-turn-helix transcriptional regulator [Bacteroidales bacterium]|nr:helix-turn-helix transcriptional regulator [Bacteroidales bacterium]